jgi:hypothetical protein
MSKRTEKTITLGSGEAFIAEYDATAGMPDVETLCVDDNRLGWIQGGAELSYSAEPHEEKDDLGMVSKVVVNEEEAILKLGLLTWNGNTLAKLADRCKVTEAAGKRTIHIGGAGNAQGKEWVVCFYQNDPKDGKLWVLIRGTNQAGLTLTFAKDAASKIEPEFKAMVQDDSGTLITVIEETGEA